MKRKLTCKLKSKDRQNLTELMSDQSDFPSHMMDDCPQWHIRPCDRFYKCRLRQYMCLKLFYSNMISLILKSSDRD